MRTTDKQCLIFTQDCDRPFSTPKSNDQQMLRNFDVFRPPFTANCRNWPRFGSSDNRDRPFHSNLLFNVQKHNIPIVNEFDISTKTQTEFSKNP